MRLLSKIISYIFHPLMMLTFIICIFLLVNPYLFGRSSIKDGWWIIFQVFQTTFLLPAFAVLMMKHLGLVQSLEMEERTDRIIPYISSGIFYIWVYMSVKSNSAFPIVFDIAVLGSTISLFMAFFVNNFSKVSAHATGVGGLISSTLVMMHWFSFRSFYWGNAQIEIPVYRVLMTVILIAGMVCSARLYLNAHDGKDIVQGLFIGFLGSAIATWYFLW